MEEKLREVETVLKMDKAVITIQGVIEDAKKLEDYVFEDNFPPSETISYK